MFKILTSLKFFDHITHSVLIHPWTTGKRSSPVWPRYQWTGTADRSDLAKLGSAQLNLMSLHSTLVWQLPIIEHKIGRRGDRSWKQQRPLYKPHDDDDNDDDDDDQGRI